MNAAMHEGLFALPAFTTQSGVTLGLALAYRVYGKLNREKSNPIVVPTFYAGRADDNAYLIGAGKALDPACFCIVVPNLF